MDSKLFDSENELFDFTYEVYGSEHLFYLNEVRENVYDGSDKGIRTFYERVGLEHHWSWIGDDFDESFTFVISPEGYGRYYDFTNVPDGESIKPRDVYKVRKVRKR